LCLVRSLGVVELRQYLSMFAGHSAHKSAELPLTSSISDADGGVDHPTPLESNHIFRQIAAIGCDFVTVHRRTGEVDDCSFSNLDFHGLHSDDLLADGFMERVHINDRPACLGAFSRACHDDEKISLELRLRCPSDDVSPDHFRWIEMACSSFGNNDSDGADDRQVLCVARDITRWKQREEQLVTNELMAREVIDSNTRYLANMSHALRTPLNAIIGFSDMMMLPGLEAQNEQQVVEYACIINDSGKNLLGVVDEVLDMSQFDAGQYRLDPQIFSVAELVKASLEFVQSEAEEKSVRIVVVDLDETLQMNADFRLCRQALVILLAVKIKEMPEDLKGRVHLLVTSSTDSIEFTASGSDSVDEACLHLSGTGARLQAFVDLLSGELQSGNDVNGQNETVLKLPLGFVAGAEIGNVVSIDNQLATASAPLKKLA
jgi:His Kinase A (phospho-acceptor) domain